jgi:hypothetical protein
LLFMLGIIALFLVEMFDNLVYVELWVVHSWSAWFGFLVVGKWYLNLNFKHKMWQ